MAKVTGLTRIVEALRSRAARVLEESNVCVVVGYTQSYAIYVHENLLARHPVGQAQFLLAPARQLNNNGTLGGLFKDARRLGKTVAQSLLVAGLRLQRESQRLCPVDTGALRASAFTRMEGAG